MSTEKQHSKNQSLKYISRLRDVFDTYPKKYNLSTLLREIQTGKTTVADHPKYKSLAELTDFIRNEILGSPHEEKREAYSEVKKYAPQFSPSALLDTRSTPQSLSHIVCLEYDDPDIDTPLVLAAASQNPHCIAAFQSFSHKPKILLALSGTSTDGDLLSADNFKFAWSVAAQEFEEFGDADPSAQKVTQLQALVYDPNIYINSDPLPLEWQIDEEEYLESWGVESAPADIVVLSELDDRYKIAIQDFDDAGAWKDNGWARVSVPCPFSEHDNDGWDLRTNATGIRKNNENDYTLHCFKCEKKKRFTDTPLNSGKPVKLHKTGTELVLDTLDKSRDFLSSLFEKAINVFGIRADTGVGKNEAVIQYVLTGVRTLMNLPHKNLSDELVERFDKAEVDAFQYRGILSNPKGTFPDESPCINPYQYDLYARKGGDARRVICAHCDFRITCEEAGHWHDIDQLNKYQVDLFTFPGLFTNPIFRRWIKQNLGTLTADDLIIHDDLEISELFVDVVVERDWLETVSKQHNGTLTGDFADIVLSIIHKDELYEALKRFVVELTDTERDSVIEGLSNVRVDDKVMSLDDAVEAGHFSVKSMDDIETLPKVQDRDWTLVNQLELFFDMYPYGDNAPINYHKGTLTFALAPILPKTPAKIGFMSATMQKEHLQRTFPKEYYPNVEFFDAESTEWHPDAKVYQLATNRNPRRTVLNEDKTLNDTGEKYWSMVMDKVEQLGGRHAIITYKGVIEQKQEDIEKYQLVTANYHGLVGLDDKFLDVDYLHVLFSPERPPYDLEWNAKLIYGGDTDTLSFERDEAGTFIDPRVQSVYDAGALAELIQAIGRVRLVNYGNCVFVYCSHYLPTITERDQTLLFADNDLEIWTDGNTDTFESIIKERLEKEDVQTKALEQAQKKGDTKRIIELTGVGERQAYRKGKEGAKANKVERDAEIIRRNQAGESGRQIAKEMNIGLSTAQRIINNHGVTQN